MKRRDFLKAATVGGVAGAMTGCSKEAGGGSGGMSTKTFTWKMVTTWPSTLPVLADSAKLIARWCEEMSGGRLKIKVFGGGELVPPLEAFDTVRQGTVAQMGHAASYYWAGKVAAAQFFASVPFGMNAQQMNAWLYGGNGLKLWREVYGQFGLIPFPVGNSGVQMGGWFNKEIRTVEDLKGLKMRIPGLGGKVISKAGGTAILSPGAEIYTNLERGVIDATEWVGPFHDFKMGFHKIAKYYYYPGWHEPGTVIECFVNKKAYDSLPADLQAIVATACHRSNAWMVPMFDAENHRYLAKIKEETKVRILPFPDEVLKALKGFTDEVIEELIAEDEQSKRVYEDFDAFRKQVTPWAKISEQAYYEKILT